MPQLKQPRINDVYVLYNDKVFRCPVCNTPFITKRPNKIYCRMYHRDIAQHLMNYSRQYLYRLSSDDKKLRDKLLALRSEGVIS